jgi:DNA (cytosine-5)-methyltransferase 1
MLFTDDHNPISQRSNPRLHRQVELVRRGIKANIPLKDLLKKEGWTYDDLQYLHGERPKLRLRKPLLLDNLRTKPLGVPVVSFFSGAGGLDLGLETAGFEHLAAIEKSEIFCETLRSNRPRWSIIGPPLFEGDVSHFDDIAEILKRFIGPQKFEGIFVGGPPCQPFSIAANQRFSKSGENFKRIGFAHKVNGNLLFDFIRLIQHFKPRAFLIENVPGLRDVDNGDQIKKAYELLAKAGYSVAEPIEITASEYGVPQSRRRLFIVGARGRAREFIPPEKSSAFTPVGLVFNQSLKDVLNHETREHSAESVYRYMQLPYGGRDQLGRVDRLDPIAPSKTIIAGGSKGGGRSHLHPYIPRTLSVRESARIQTFPDTYIFTGAVARQFTQVGNAVPPVLGAQLGAAIYSSFFE